MTDQEERRHLNALRTHIDCLLEAGASIVSREPLTLLFQSQRLSVSQGVIVSETGVADLIETLAAYNWPTSASRQLAMQICVAQLNRAVEASVDVAPAEPCQGTRR